MKYLSMLVFILGLMLSSCSKNDEPPMEVNLPVIRSYMPATLSFNADDAQTKDKIRNLVDKQFVVNDASELPDDPFGFSKAYSDVDFNNYSLLITYNLHSWNIDTYYNRYYRNNNEKTYNWAICIGTSTIPDSDADQVMFTRYSILVKKLPADADIKMWFSVGALNWDWEQ